MRCRESIVRDRYGERTRKRERMGKREDDVKRKNDELDTGRKNNDRMQTLWIRRGTREGGPKTLAENEETLERDKGVRASRVWIRRKRFIGRWAMRWGS